MTSVLNVDTIANKAGTGPVGLTKQQAAKMYVNHQMAGANSTRDSFNVSSITDHAAGNYSANFTNNMSANDYGFFSTTSGDSGNYGYSFPAVPGGGTNEFAYSSSAIRAGSGFASDTSSTANAVDVHQINAMTHGDLA